MRTTYTGKRLVNPDRELNLEWRKVMKSPSRTCWETGQPYNGLGAWLQHNRKMTSK
jgi:hypothetical protein